MSRDTKEVDRLLRECGPGPGPDPVRRREALEAVREAAERKKLCYTPSLFRLFAIQLQYISPAFWAVQGMLLAGALLLPRWTGPRGEEPYLWWGSLAAAWMGLAACGELSRHFSRGMAELEQSCYLDLAQMWTMRMILSGAVDIVLLSVCCLGIARGVRSAPWQVCVYLLVPFVLSNCCCLWAVTELRGGRSRYVLALLALSMALLALLPSLEPAAYEAKNFWIWAAALLSGAGLWVRQLRRCYKRIAEGEILCWS